MPSGKQITDYTTEELKQLQEQTKAGNTEALNELVSLLQYCIDTGKGRAHTGTGKQAAA